MINAVSDAYVAKLKVLADSTPWLVIELPIDAPKRVSELVKLLNVDRASYPITWVYGVNQD